jgi:hypothetical protein
MGPPGGDDPSTRRGSVNKAWKVVIVGGGFGGLSAAQHDTLNVRAVSLLCCLVPYAQRHKCRALIC